MRIFKEKQSTDFIEKLESSIEQFNYEKIKERFLDKISFKTLSDIKDYALMAGAGTIVGSQVTLHMALQQPEIVKTAMNIGFGSVAAASLIGYGLAKSFEYMKNKQYDTSKKSQLDVLENLQPLRSDAALFNDVISDYRIGVENKKMDTDTIITKIRKARPE